MNVEKSFTINDLEAITPGQLRALLDEVPSVADMSVREHAGDYGRDNTFSLTFSWPEEIRA